MMPSKHVLVVDDDSVLAAFIAETLVESQPGCSVSVARSGEEALERLYQGPVDVLVTDLRMSGIDGLALIRWARAFHPDVPAILMTADRRSELALRARSCGAWRTVFKSSGFTERLECAVRDALCASQARRIAGSGNDGKL